MYNNLTPKSENTSRHKRKHTILGTVIKVGKRTVGQVIGNKYVKDITNNHLLTTPPAIASDITALQDAERAGAEYCVFTNTETGIIYRAAISKIWETGTRFNRGWGDQIYLTLPNWTQSRDSQFVNQTVTPAYSQPTLSDCSVSQLHVESHMAVGIHYKKGKKTQKQLSLFGEDDDE